MSIIFDNDYYNDKSITREFSLKNTHIGYNNLTGSATLTGSSSAAGFPVSALNNQFTYDFWRSSLLPASVIVDTGAQNAVDYIGLAKHNLAGIPCSVSYSVDGLTYTPCAAFSLTDNDAAMVIFNQVIGRYFKFSADPTSELEFGESEFGAEEAVFASATDDTAYAQIAVLNIGKSLEMQRMIFGGHSPAKLTDEAETRPSISEGGSWLGRSVIRRGTQTEYSFNNLTGAWYRTKFLPFTQHAVTEPFFIAWRPLGYANECQYAWTNQAIQPNNSGPRDWLSVSFTAQGCE